MYTPPLWFPGVNILVRFKSHGLFSGNGCILYLLALAVSTVAVTLCLCSMWMSFQGEKSKHIDTRVTANYPSAWLDRLRIARERGGVVVGAGKKKGS